MTKVLWITNIDENRIIVEDKATSTIENMKYSFDIIGKDKKVVVYKYKRKSGYHKKNGHRQYFTEVKIDSI